MRVRANAIKVWFDQDNLWILLSDGRQMSVPLAYCPRLINASSAQREKFILSGNGTGIHWDELDEDISVENLILGIGDLTSAK